MSSLSDSRREVQSEESSRIESTHTELLDDEPLARRLIRQRSVPKPPSRTFKTAKPKISTTRLNYIASSHDVGDSNQRFPTKFTFEDLKRMANLYPWPEGVTLCLPVDHGDSLAKYPNCLVVHEESLKAGFRLPIPTFTKEFLKWTELCPAQVTPNSWRSISAYGIRCWELKKEPTFLGMQYLFAMTGMGNFFTVYMRNLGIISNPSSLKGWKNKWFLVKKGGGFNFDFPIHPGCGVKFRKGVDEIKEISGEARELRDALLRIEQTNPRYSELVSLENLEKAGLSLPHPRQSMKLGLNLIKCALREQNNRPSSRSEGASKKKTVGSRSPPEKEDERPLKKRFDTAQAPEHIDIAHVPSSAKSRTHQPVGASFRRPCSTADSHHSSEGRHNPQPPRQPNYLASSLTLEEANGLLKGATMNVDVVSTLGRLPDEQVTAEFVKALALSVYHANNLIEKHEKLQSSGSHVKLEGLKEDFSKERKELKQELLRTKESAKRNEENMQKEIQSLKDIIKKTHEENAEQHQRIQELEMDLSVAKKMAKEEFLNSSSFDRRVAHFNATYYMSGLRVGVHQAVRKFQHLDPKIVEFEPDFEDDCGYEVLDPPPYSSPFRLIPYP